MFKKALLIILGVWNLTFYAQQADIRKKLDVIYQQYQGSCDNAYQRFSRQLLEQ